MPELLPLETDPNRHADVAAAIEYLVRNYAAQPSLDDVARIAGISPHHFQRTFKDWTGISPKRFLQYVTLVHARKLLKTPTNLLDTAFDLGLSGPGRLHDLFVACEAVTPGDYKRRGGGLCIHYGLHDSPFGRVLIGVTERGICGLGFVTDDDAAAVGALAGEWPAAELIENAGMTAAAAKAAFDFAFHPDPSNTPPRLLVMGTNFQIKVWEALMRIPRGGVVSYQDIAGAIGKPKAARAIGHAVGANPIAMLIPCHRVILKSGVLHHYRWGVERKGAILALEQAGEQAGMEE
ncbi:MAG: methylated-DNA--[protein]-cysteine S-methyltransferase [Proteobacteria bacterium]|nr:methylated-DNA--[protein]-cysteine S-methyltransferase [Pseudomonadota bacterium]